MGEVWPPHTHTHTTKLHHRGFLLPHTRLSSIGLRCTKFWNKKIRRSEGSSLAHPRNTEMESLAVERRIFTFLQEEKLSPTALGIQPNYCGFFSPAQNVNRWETAAHVVQNNTDRVGWGGGRFFRWQTASEFMPSCVAVQNFVKSSV